MLDMRIKINGAYIENLLTEAYLLGYRRVDPRKAWKDAERKEAIRFVIEYWIKDLKT